MQNKHESTPNSSQPRPPHLQALETHNPSSEELARGWYLIHEFRTFGPEKIPSILSEMYDSYVTSYGFVNLEEEDRRRHVHAFRTIQRLIIGARDGSE